jgi:DNA-directed RNA polymerase subunit K/omega
MLYGRRLDQSLEHVDGSRYALVHAVSKRARQITLWLTADPAELRAEAAPPPAPGELTSRDPVALAEAEILEGEVVVRWDPEGLAEEIELPEIEELQPDPLLIEGVAGDDDEDADDDSDDVMTPALAQVLEGEPVADDVEEEAVVEDEPEAVVVPGVVDEVEEISLEDVDEGDADDDEDAL